MAAAFPPRQFLGVDCELRGTLVRHAAENVLLMRWTGINDRPYVPHWGTWVRLSGDSYVGGGFFFYCGAQI